MSDEEVKTQELVTEVKTPEQRQKQRRGFALISPELQRKIASKGGIASHRAGTGHEWNSQTASAAGKLGGRVSRGGRGKLP